MQNFYYPETMNGFEDCGPLKPNGWSEEKQYEHFAERHNAAYRTSEWSASRHINIISEILAPYENTAFNGSGKYLLLQYFVPWMTEETRDAVADHFSGKWRVTIGFSSIGVIGFDDVPGEHYCLQINNTDNFYYGGDVIEGSNVDIDGKPLSASNFKGIRNGRLIDVEHKFFDKEYGLIGEFIRMIRSKNKY